MRRYAGLRYGALDGEVRVSLAEAERNWYGRDLMAHLLAGLAGTEVLPVLPDL